MTGVYECSQGGIIRRQIALYVPIKANCYDKYNSLTTHKGDVVRASCDGSCRAASLPFPTQPLTTSDFICSTAKAMGKIPPNGGDVTFIILDKKGIQILNDNGSPVILP